VGASLQSYVVGMTANTRFQQKGGRREWQQKNYIKRTKGSSVEIIFIPSIPLSYSYSLSFCWGLPTFRYFPRLQISSISGQLTHLNHSFCRLVILFGEVSLNDPYESTFWMQLLQMPGLDYSTNGHPNKK
jgi:hypothetical protein